MAQRYRELSNKYANATNASICVVSFEKENQMLKAQVESLTSKHVALQGTHKELEYSYKKLVESHAMLEVAQEVVLTTVKSYQPLTHTCTCSQVEILLSCDKPYCFQATNPCVEHIVAESCDDLITEENDELKQEVEELKMEVIKLKSKGQVQNSQDNRDDMVKKLEKGSNLTTSAPQQGQSKRKSLVQVKRLLVLCNVTNKIRKRTDTAVAFTQQYSRVSYLLGNVSTLSMGSDSSRTHTLVWEG